MYAVWERVLTVTVKKVVDSPISSDQTREFGFSATINSGTPDTFQLANNGEKKYENLKVGTTFALTETAVDEFETTFAVDGGNAVATLETLTLSDDITIVVTNTRKSTPITLEKIDSSGHQLAGAKFELTRKTDSWAVVQSDITLGILNATNNLYSDTVYRLEEKQPPTGFILTKNYFYFKLQYVPATETAAESWNILVTDENGNETTDDLLRIDRTKLQVVNTPGQALPVTGGTGTMKYTVAGAILILTALCFGCALRRRERRFDH